MSNSCRAGKRKDDAPEEGQGPGNAVDPESRLAYRPEALRSIIATGSAEKYPACRDHGSGLSTARKASLALID